MEDVNNIFKENKNKGKIEIIHSPIGVSPIGTGEYGYYNVNFKISPNVTSLNIVKEFVEYFINNDYFEVGQSIDIQGDYDEIPPIIYIKSINYLNELLRDYNVPLRVIQYDGTFEILNYLK
jgi:hypothetical protein